MHYVEHERCHLCGNQGCWVDHPRDREGIVICPDCSGLPKPEETRCGK